MYYVKLLIEESAIGNITDLLRPFVSDTNVHVDDLQKTTSKLILNVKSGTFWLILIRKNYPYEVKLFCFCFWSACKSVSDGTECSCEPRYRWSDALCESKQCCGNGKCTFPKNSPLMCVANTTGIWVCCGLCWHRHIHCVYASVRRADNVFSSQLPSPGPFLCHQNILTVWLKRPLKIFRPVITNC